MFTAKSSRLLHFSQNASLILLSLLFLPLNTFLLVTSYALQFLDPQHVARERATQLPGFQPRTVLVTGVGMSKGLALARMFYQSGHTVIGADFEPFDIPVSGRFSKALTKFYTLPKPSEKEGSYVQELLRIVRRDHVDLWVSCSGVASALEDGLAKEFIERRSDCKAIQFDVTVTTTLHEKNSFIQHTMSLGLPVPETHDVASRAAVHKVLHGAEKRRKQYIMKSVGLDDTTRGDMTRLPRRTLSQTYQHIAKIPISTQRPWVLQEFIDGEEYCTHALVVNGEVHAFVACPSLELLMHYEALPSSSALSQAMLRFTQEFVAKSGSSMTGHLSFDFLVQETATEKGLGKSIYPIECNPRAHTAVILFRDQGEEMARRYLRALDADRHVNGYANGHTSTDGLTNGLTNRVHRGDISSIVTPQKPQRYYWVGHDIVTLLILPALSFLTGKIKMMDFGKGCFTFIYHLLFWKDGTYEMWDPLPFWWLYQIYWPGQFLSCIWRGYKWSRVNVSTAKMFGC